MVPLGHLGVLLFHQDQKKSLDKARVPMLGKGLDSSFDTTTEPGMRVSLCSW